MVAADTSLEERMDQPVDGSIKPVEITEQERRAVRENDHHGTRSSLYTHTHFL
tara:strand:- start:1154 stop:1312 length:159 start_codon:yes stop_codon:yes gene_type:complete